MGEETKIKDVKDNEKNYEQKEIISKEPHIFDRKKSENVDNKEEVKQKEENVADDSVRTAEEKYDIESKENITISNGEKETVHDSKEAKIDNYDTLDISSKKDESDIKQDDSRKTVGDVTKKSETTVKDEVSKSNKEDLYKSEETTVTTSVKKEVIIETTNKVEVSSLSSKDDLQVSKKTAETIPNKNQEFKVEEEIQERDVKGESFDEVGKEEMLSCDANEESDTKRTDNEQSSHITSNDDLSDESKSNLIASNEKAPDSFINEIYEAEGRQSRVETIEPVSKISKTEIIEQKQETEEFKNDKDKNIKKEDKMDENKPGKMEKEKEDIDADSEAIQNIVSASTKDESNKEKYPHEEDDKKYSGIKEDLSMTSDKKIFRPGVLEITIQKASDLVNNDKI